METKKELTDSVTRAFHTTTLMDHYLITLGGTGRDSQGSIAIHNDIAILDLRSNICSSYLTENNFFTPKKGHSACQISNNQILVYGGIDQNGVSKEIGILSLNINPYNVTFAQFETVSSHGTVGFSSTLYRTHHTATCYQDQVYVFGGKDRNENPTNQTWCLQIKTWLWSRVETIGAKPDPIWGHSSILYGDKIYFFGGYSEKNKQSMKDLWTLTLRNLEWDKIHVSGDIPQPRRNASSVLAGDSIIIFGGYVDKIGYSNELFSFDIKELNWKRINLENGTPTPRANHTAILYRGNLIIWGGQTSTGYLNEINRLNIGLDPSEGSYATANKSKQTTEKFSIEILSKGKALPYFAQMAKMFNDKLFTDIAFVVKGKEIPAHRAILTARCKFFEHMLTSGMKESIQEKIEITDVKYETFNALLQFLYCNEVSIDEQLAQDLIEVSDKYSLPELKTLCEEFLSPCIRLDNFVELAEISERYDTTILKNAIVEFAVKNLRNLEQRGDANLISKSMLWNIIMKLGNKF